MAMFALAYVVSDKVAHDRMESTGQGHVLHQSTTVHASPTLFKSARPSILIGSQSRLVVYVTRNRPSVQTSTFAPPDLF